MPDDVPYKRQRVSKACDSCRRKKVKCDGIQPACGNCSAFNLECTYNDTTKKRGPPKGYIEAIETRLHRMESLLGGLVHSNDPRAEAVLAELMQDDLRSQHKAGKVDFTTYHGKDNPIIDDLNEVMGILSIDENNQVRYHGRSSGLYLLKKSDKYKDGILSIKSRSNWSHPGEVIASTQSFDLLKRSELTELPSQEISDHLLELFFTHVHPILPFIYKPRFFDQLKDKDHLPHLLLNSIYSFAALFSDRLDIRRIPEDHTTAGDIYFDRAKALLDNDYDKARVSTIQALLVLSLREYGVGRVTRAWLWSGMAARMAQDLGMHRNNEKWHPINLTREEREEQKRVFWACFVLDRIPSAHLGRPLAIDEKDVDAAHPSEDEDDEHEPLPFKMEHVTVSSTSSPVSSSNSLIGSPLSSSTSHRNHAHSVSRFNHLLKLCEIMGRIIQNVYAIRSTHVSMTTDTVLSILDSSLTSWYLNLPQHLQYNPSSSDQPTDSPTLVLHILYYSALMLLHQPYSAGQQSSHNICSQAANAITDIADTLMKRNILRHSLNVVVYCLFTASVIHTYNATQEDTSISQPAKVNLAKSLNVLKELKNIWPTTHKYVDLLHGLVDLKDVQLDSSPILKSSTNIDGARSSRKRVNSSNSTQQSPSVGIVDRHVRQARFRAQYNQSTSSENENDDDSAVSPHFNTVPSSLNPSTTYQRLPSVLNFNHMSLTSQPPQFNSPPFTQPPQPARQQLRHDLPESAQMFNNTLGFRYMTSNTNDPQNQPTIGDTDPYAAPGMATNNGVGNNTFEPINSGFWGIPHNADLDEWSSFLGSQYASPTLPSQSAHLPIPRRVPSITSSTTGSLSSLQRQRQQQILLHNDGNDVNMFADNHPLISDVVGINNNGGKRASTSFNNSSNNGNNSGTGDNSTVPLAYY
ncbi:fungal-specific transcription factor domain-containing protein [Glomus cerebriforme]|uniref:Fungal-specific transcription factor domain-containing protein n=1 Tax=Glomus cerebriforme TaxID=658196 RepID=A0A397TGS2_9GLOM|nr:fungal-specific transcription factor domain-containing protein [Glomus cerebriforme]